MNEGILSATDSVVAKIPRVISIVSGKGGTGKTIIAASIGHVLAHCGFRVLLIDTDLFTRGLSFYLISDEPYLATAGLSDFLLENASIEQIDKIRVPDKFARSNLFFMPATAKLRAHRPELGLAKRDLVQTFSRKLRVVVTNARGVWKFEYVIIDTRGGTDETSMAAARISDGYVVVTEADKTSWDVTEVLLNGIEALHINAPAGLEKRLGFILNKNTLPEKELVNFLRQRFLCRDLAVIPLDIDAVRYFQNDEVPVTKDVTIPFSEKIVAFCEKLFRPFDVWPEKQKGRFGDLRDRITYEHEKRKRAERMRESSARFRSLIGPMTVATIALSVSILALLDIGFSRTAQVWVLLLIAYLATLSAFLSTPEATKRLLKLLQHFLERKR